MYNADNWVRVEMFMFQEVSEELNFTFFHQEII